VATKATLWVAFAGDDETLHVKGLRVDAAVNRIGEELAEICRGDIGGSEDGFAGVGAGAEIVVVLREYVDLCYERHGCRKKIKKRERGTAMRRGERSRKKSVLEIRETNPRTNWGIACISHALVNR